MTKFINESELETYLEKNGLSSASQEIKSLAKKMIDSLVRERLKIQKNKKRIADNDAKKEQIKATHVLDESEISTLPMWVKEDIQNAYLVGSSKKVIQISDGRKFHRDNRLNHLSGGEWTYGLTSVINTRYPTRGPEGFAHEIRKVHPSPKPPQLMGDIIKFFTKPGDYVLDYFMGVGGTLLGASLHGRNAVGIDLEEKYISTYEAAADALSLKRQSTLIGDSIECLNEPSRIMALTKGNKFPLVLIDPPYGDMMARPKTGEAVKKGMNTAATPFTNLEYDLGNLSWDLFRSKFKASVNSVSDLMTDKGHLVVFIKDLQPKPGSPNLLHADLVADISSLSGFEYCGMRIWADQGVNLYPYGYPYSFVSNQIHQYILIFRKG